MSNNSRTVEFRPGSLVHARGRNWVVLSPEEEGFIRLRPIDGTDAEATGLLLALEGDSIRASEYPPPDPSRPGDLTAALVLRDAVRLALRSGAGPFRSTGRLSFTPRPYQFVPLIMALRMERVRLLIADDVGVGKTIEACMIARELLDRGVVKRIAVLCAPHLCAQWEKELREKFSIEAAVIQSSRMGRLVRDLPRRDLSPYLYYRHLVASIDFVKTDRQQGAFIDNCPDLVIVDEAHASARPRGQAGHAQHERFQLLAELAKNPDRHIILVTATPHSGIEESFRSLLGLLDSRFDLPETANVPLKRLVTQVVQRQRTHLQRWLGEDTPFPRRESEESQYVISDEYLKLFHDVLAYCRESVSSPDNGSQQQRVRYWAAVAILRCLLSSPAAATTMLKRRQIRTRRGPADSADMTTGEDTDSAGLLDFSDEEEQSDYVPSASLDSPDTGLTTEEDSRLNGFLKRAERLGGPDNDGKLAKLMTTVSEFLAEGYHPIVFCRYIPTAYYVAEHLQRKLGMRFSGLQVRGVTGDDGDSEQREQAVSELCSVDTRVLVATECLSEGLNLQEHFDAIIHYDLPWNPNRLEQREGRVDRYGQNRKVVRVALLYGVNNPVDLVVLDVLIAKARKIRERLGISVPVPMGAEEVLNAVIDGVLLLRRTDARQLQLGLADPQVNAFHAEWDKRADNEAEMRAFFAQEGIKPDEVARELRAVETVLGSQDDVRCFVADALHLFNGSLNETGQSGVFNFHPGDLERQYKEQLGEVGFPARIRFKGIASERETYVGRNHPFVSVLSAATIGRALASDDGTTLARCGVAFSSSVNTRTAVYVLRLRYGLSDGREQFAEEVVTAALKSEGDKVSWLFPLDDLRHTMFAQSCLVGNPSEEEAIRHIQWALRQLEANGCDGIVADRVKTLRESHARIRGLVGGPPLDVAAHDPDVLGCYVILPAGGG